MIVVTKRIQRPDRRLKHGDVRGNRQTPEYKAWAAMRNRCRSERNSEYHRYGGRGIKVCDRWTDYSNFLEDMGRRPEGTSLDRINNDGNYEPSNCRWATRIEQNRNRSGQKLTEREIPFIRHWLSIGYTQKSIADVFGVGKTIVGAIAAGDKWKGV